LNWSAMAAISERRPDLRKARRKRRFWVSAALKERHLEIMTAQEMTDIMTRTPSTTSAVGPLLCSISTIALEDWPAGGGPSGTSVWVAASCRKRAKANRVIGVVLSVLAMRVGE